MCEVVAENALDPLSFRSGWLHAPKVKTIQYSALRLSTNLNILFGLFMFMELFLFFFNGAGEIVQCSNIAFHYIEDLQTCSHKS